MEMLYTVLMQQEGTGQRIFQAEGEDLNNALSHWAEGFEDDKLTKSGRRELVEFVSGLDGDEIRLVSGHDLNRPHFYKSVWFFEKVLDLKGESESGTRTTFLIIKTSN